MSATERIAVYGKGGIGKSVVATGLSVHFAEQGKRVLHVGCDPKGDSSLRLLGRLAPRTVVDVLGMEPAQVFAAALINHARSGVMCLESGGPEPGLGCGGRGVARAVELIGEVELLESDDVDVAIFDVLGDVVCGGFAAPLRRGFAQKVAIVVSAEPMALFAANNIAKAVVTHEPNGVVLAGLVSNRRTNDEDQARVDAFARHLGTRVVGVLQQDPAIVEAERQCTTVLEHAPSSRAASELRQMARALEQLAVADCPSPHPLSQQEILDFIRK